MSDQSELGDDVDLEAANAVEENFSPPTQKEVEEEPEEISQTASIEESPCDKEEPPPDRPKTAFAQQKEENRRNVFGTIRSHVIDYCDNTTAHGFAYLGSGGKGCLERLFWAIVIATGLGSASVLIDQGFA